LRMEVRSLTWAFLLTLELVKNPLTALVNISLK
jgi:hypothetical protein